MYFALSTSSPKALMSPVTLQTSLCKMAPLAKITCRLATQEGCPRYSGRLFGRFVPGTALSFPTRAFYVAFAEPRITGVTALFPSALSMNPRTDKLTTQVSALSSCVIQTDSSGESLDWRLSGRFPLTCPLSVLSSVAGHPAWLLTCACPVALVFTRVPRNAASQ